MNDIQAYYDRNTRWFLRIGASSGNFSLHRGLWGPGVHSADQAADYLHELLAGTFLRHLGRSPAQVLDLGCGVGGTLFSLGQRFPEAALIGVTISPAQVQWARQWISKKEPGSRYQFIQADFNTLDLGLRADAIIAVEAFAHSSNPQGFFATCRRHLAPGGVLVLVDDFLTQPREKSAGKREQTLSRFQAGWHLPALDTVVNVTESAAQNGLSLLENEDLTPLIRTRRFRDRLVAAASLLARAPGFRRHPFGANLIGGHALNRALRSGWVHYRMLTLTVKPGALPVCP